MSRFLSDVKKPDLGVDLERMLTGEALASFAPTPSFPLPPC
jgi:hypothetical protein